MDAATQRAEALQAACAALLQRAADDDRVSGMTLVFPDGSCRYFGLTDAAAIVSIDIAAGNA